MNFNLTLIAQAITFALFIWFCNKYVWPFITRAIDERQKKIIAGLADAVEAKHASAHRKLSCRPSSALHR